MKAKMLLAGLLAFPLLAWATDDNKKITKDDNIFFYDGRPLNRTDLDSLLQSNPRSAPEAADAESLYGPAVGSFVVGGSLAAWYLSKALSGGAENWEMGSLGLVIAGAGYYLARRAGGHYHNAVEIFNRSPEATSLQGFDLYVGPQYLRVAWQF